MRNEEIADRFLAIHESLSGLKEMAKEDRVIIGARLAAIERKLDALAKVESAAETLADVAKAYELAGTAGRVMKWLAGIVVGVAGAIAAVKAWLSVHPGGGQ